MNRKNRKIIAILIASLTVMLITGGAVFYGFQGVLAALGLLFLLVSVGVGVYIVRKARLYANIVKQANWIKNIEVTPVSKDDKKWIMKYLDEYLKMKEELSAPAETVMTNNDKKEIMNHLDEFMMKTWIEHNTVTPEEQQFIMENVDILFSDNQEEDRQTFV